MAWKKMGRKTKRGNVHFYFASHPDGEAYLRQKTVRRGLKTHMIEDASGVPEQVNRPYLQFLKTLKSSDARFSRSIGEYAEALEKKKVHVMGGEMSAESAGELKRLQRQSEMYLHKFTAHP